MAEEYLLVFVGPILGVIWLLMGISDIFGHHEEKNNDPIDIYPWTYSFACGLWIGIFSLWSLYLPDYFADEYLTFWKVFATIFMTISSLVGSLIIAEYFLRKLAKKYRPNLKIDNFPFSS